MRRFPKCLFGLSITAFLLLLDPSQADTAYLEKGQFASGIDTGNLDLAAGTIQCTNEYVACLQRVVTTTSRDANSGRENNLSSHDAGNLDMAAGTIQCTTEYAACLQRVATTTSRDAENDRENSDSSHDNTVLGVTAPEFLKEMGDDWKKFLSWIVKYKKKYMHSAKREQRFHIWKENSDFIDKFNKDPSNSFTLAHNEFTDMNQDELKTHFGLQTIQPKLQGTSTGTMPQESEQAKQIAEGLREIQDELPDEVNWVDKGAVSAVKNQGSCGSCWAFSTTGSLEGIVQIDSGNEVLSLSEQNLLDCDNDSYGCGGGWVDNAFKFVRKTGGLCTEATYPYKEVKQNQCDTSCTMAPNVSVSTWVDVPSNEKSLLAAVSKQPVSAAIRADESVFAYYDDGVLDSSECGTMPNHAVLIVGYGTDPATGKPYWLVKNSWGDGWGEKGYVRIARSSDNSDETAGICGILSILTFPVLKPQ